MLETYHDKFPACFSILASNLSNKVRASAVEPANPATTSLFSIFLIFEAVLLTTVFPMLTCPSPAGDGQVSMGNTVVKSTASKIRKIEKRDVVAGFAGSTADALTLFERLEAKIEKHAGNLS